MSTESATVEITEVPPEARAGRSRRRAGPRILLATASVALLFGAPWYLDVFAVSVATQLLSFSLLAASLVLIMGTAGMPSLAQSAYFGVGGYAAGLLAIHVTQSAVAMLVCAALAGLVFAASTGWLLIRTRASYFLMLSLAIGELLAAAANGWIDVTGGSDGLFGIPSPTLGGLDLAVEGYLYLYTLVMALGTFVVVALIRASPFGLALRGIRDSESRMRALGYRTGWYKFAVFCIGGAVAGISGALWVTQIRFVSPHDLGFMASAFVLVAVIIGGADSLLGALVGAATIIAIRNFLPTEWEGQGPLVLGVLLVVIVYSFRGGVAALPARLAALRK